MAARSIVVVGAALSGPVAAARARETDDRARIILLERGPDANYSVGGIAQIVSEEARASSARGRVEELADTWKVEVRTGTEVTAVDPRRKSIRAGRDRLEYTSLVVASGVESIMPDIPHLAGAANVVAFRTPRDADFLLAALSSGARRAVVIGGGSLGIEAADALARRGFVTSLVERGPRLLGDFSPVMSAIAAEGLDALGVHVVTKAQIAGVEREGDDVTRLLIGRGHAIRCDVVVVAAGVRPRTGLLARAGATTILNGAVVVDDTCRTSLDSVWACGTCVARPRFWTETPAWIPQAAMADRTAQVAGAAAAGGIARLSEPMLGTTLVRAGERVVGRTGLTRAEAAKACARGSLGTVVTESPATDPMVGDGTALVVELRWDDASGAVVGGEVGGETGVDKRLDALALGLHGVLLTPHSLAEADLGHAPTFSPVRDPLNVAGGVAAACLDGLVEARTAESLAKARVTLVDVRPDDADGASAKGARRVPLGRLRESLKQLPASRPLVFLDETGRLGYLACRIARSRGRKDAAFVTGGLRAWRTAGLPLQATDR